MLAHRSLAVALVLAALAGCKESAPAATTTAPVTAPATNTAANGNAAPAPTAPPPAGTTRLALSPAASRIEFVGRKVTASHEGRFDQFTGTLDLDPEHVENSRVNVVIQMGSVQIEPARLRGHLMSPDLFNVAQFPTATFTTTSIRPGGADGATHTVTGNLTLHGQTRGVTFPARLAVTPAAATATAEFTINRRDFGIIYPGMPDDLIRDDVTIRLNLNAPRS